MSEKKIKETKEKNKKEITKKPRYNSRSEVDKMLAAIKFTKPPRTATYTTGRPTNYRPEYCEILIELMSQGKTVAGVCSALNTHREVLWSWLKDHPAFYNAYKEGMEKAEEYWAEMGAQNIFSGNGFNDRIWKFWMACRHQWRDRDATVIVATDGNNNNDKILELVKEIRKVDRH